MIIQCHQSTHHHQPALCQPKLIFFDGFIVATQSENSEIRKLAKSVNKWAASVIIAKLLAIEPPESQLSFIECIIFDVFVVFKIIW